MCVTPFKVNRMPKPPLGFMLPLCTQSESPSSLCGMQLPFGVQISDLEKESLVSKGTEQPRKMPPMRQPAILHMPTLCIGQAAQAVDET